MVLVLRSWKKTNAEGGPPNNIIIMIRLTIRIMIIIKAIINSKQK